jgi:manganese oxidase
MGHPFDALQKGYTEAGPHRIARVYKKAVYREYTDDTFKILKKRDADEAYLGILGPVLRAEVGDTVKVVFRNNATHPFRMHPHGVLYQKDSEGSDYDDGTTGRRPPYSRRKAWREPSQGPASSIPTSNGP